jgi:DNA mismatch endonuclease (patch repair protein)
MTDNLTREQRSRTMSRIRSTDTGPELEIRRRIYARGLRFRKCDRQLLGKPDLVFRRAMVAVFVDGDFWHGWRFPSWKSKLAPYWRKKIDSNRRRDRRNHKRLARMGWTVVRIWQHQLEADPIKCVDRIEKAVRGRITSKRRHVRAAS